MNPEHPPTTGDDCWHVYVVRCSDASLYTGVAKDVSARIAEHNAGHGAKYTRGRTPVVLVYTEAAPDRGSAQRREAQIKQLSTAGKRQLTGLCSLEVRASAGARQGRGGRCRATMSPSRERGRMPR